MTTRAAAGWLPTMRGSVGSRRGRGAVRGVRDMRPVDRLRGTMSTSSRRHGEDPPTIHRVGPQGTGRSSTERDRGGRRRYSASGTAEDGARIHRAGSGRWCAHPPSGKRGMVRSPAERDSERRCGQSASGPRRTGGDPARGARWRSVRAARNRMGGRRHACTLFTCDRCPGITRKPGLLSQVSKWGGTFLAGEQDLDRGVIAGSGSGSGARGSASSGGGSVRPGGRRVGSARPDERWVGVPGPVESGWVLPPR